MYQCDLSIMVGLQYPLRQPQWLLCYSPYMTPLTNTQGLSRIETVSIVGIACFAVVLLLALGSYMLSLMQQGNDANALNTAQGVAAVEAAGGCLVPWCSGGNDAAHRKHLQPDGANVAYYAKGANTLVADPPAGYNEGDTLVVDGKEQHVERGTMIIKATLKDHCVSCFWIEA